MANNNPICGRKTSTDPAPLITPSASMEASQPTLMWLFTTAASQATPLPMMS